MESDTSVDCDIEVECEDSKKGTISGHSYELKRNGEEFHSNGVEERSCDSESSEMRIQESMDTVKEKNDVELTDGTSEDQWSNALSDSCDAPIVKEAVIACSEEEHKLEGNQDLKCSRAVICDFEDEAKDGILDKNTADIAGPCDSLSCVSDTESNEGQNIDTLNIGRHQNHGDSESTLNVCKRKMNDPVVEVEQLDFEAEEIQEKEEGECEVREDKSDEGELVGDDLEEGELTDEEENRPEETEPRPICRFYSRGQCTWGSSCRFVHPGVTDKGNYTMFDVVRPLIPVNGHPVYQIGEYRSQFDKFSTIGMTYASPAKEEPVVFESAWERGLRQAKEMMRKSSQRKETDMDFEEKKMNLSLGQEELDKENDYYIRSASPVYKEDERWNIDVDFYSYREDAIGLEHYSEIPETSYYHRSRGTSRDYWRRVHYETETNRTIRLEPEYVSFRRERSASKYHSHHQHRQTTQELYDKYDRKTTRQKSHSTRVVTVEPSDKHRKDEKYGDTSLSTRRGDEWADPWMRSKSPITRKGGHVSRRRSHSSGSPRSSSGHSRSSSQSSHHSVNYSSRSKVQSKKSAISSNSHNMASHAHKNPRKVLLPTPRTIESRSPPVGSSQKSSKHVGESRDNRSKLMSSYSQLEKKAASERALLMNPPAPSPQRHKETQPHSPAMMRRSAQNPPPPHVSPVRSNSSISSSGSDSSGSSSDSSESSCSSSSSSREPSPKAVYPPKRLIMEERGRLALAAESLKVKAMDALKLSGQKQQIKLTLKTSANIQNKSKTVSGLPDLPQLNLVRKDRILPTLVGRKRPAENTDIIDSGISAKVTSLPKPAQKTVISRREELLKQLKAVEDAIARKRSKI